MKIFFCFLTSVAFSVAIGMDINPTFSVDAAKRYKEKADQGDAESQYLYARWRIQNFPSKEELACAACYCHKSALQNYGPSLRLMARSYANGWSGETNQIEAAKWYSKAYTWASMAADDGNAVAQYQLSACYNRGEGVAKDKRAAFKWLLRAANQGCIEAQESLARNYEYGYSGCEKNPIEATKWYLKAAENGSADAQYAMGRRYERGDGVRKNRDEAEKWYRRSLEFYKKEVEGGYYFAQRKVADCYKSGRGTLPNASLSKEWNRRAVENIKDKASKGNAFAQYLLGQHYENGEGVEENRNEAIKWYRLAAKQGDVSSVYSLKRLKVKIDDKRELSAEELIESAKAKKANTFVFKGFYLGMPEYDALALLRHYDFTTNYRISSEGIVCEDKSVPYAPVVAQIKNGVIVEFRFSRRMVDLMFKTEGSPAKDFAQAMVNAYDAIAELSPKLVEVANWKARKFTNEDVAQMASLAWASNAGAKDAGRALEEKVAETMSAKQTTLGYYCSNPRLGFDLTIAPTDEPVKSQTDFFVVRKTCKVDVGNFD